MRLPSRLVLCVLGLCLLLGGGCRRQTLDDERTVSLDAGALKSFPVDAPRRDEKVTVTFSSPGVPVSVYLVDAKAAEQAIDTIRPPANALASAVSTEQGTIEGTVPAKTEFAVVLHNPGTKATQVKMTIKGR
jgi:hypothetical protein